MLLVLNNGLTICFLYSNGTGVRTVSYPVSFSNFCVCANCIHWEVSNDASVCVGNQTNYNIKIFPYPTNLNTLVGIICIGR